MYEYNAETVKVITGDTIIANIDCGFSIWIKGIKIKLAEIDCEPVNTLQGTEAKKFMKSILPEGGKFIIETQWKKKGKYNQVLGIVWIDKGDQSLNEVLFGKGLAKRYL